MKRRTVKKDHTPAPATKGSALLVVEQLKSMAHVIRQSASPEEAAEALIWEQKLEERIKELQPAKHSNAA